MIVAAVASVVAAIAGGVVKQIAQGVLFFIALKILLIAIFTLLLPVILNNFIYSFLENSIAIINSSVDLSPDSGTSFLEMVGLMAWLAERFRLPECFSIFVTGIQLRIVLKMLPFSPVK